MKEFIYQLNEFYPEYLKAHGDKNNRLLHFTGASLFFILLILSIVLWNGWLLLAAVVGGYLLPGLGHRFFEHNKSFRSSKPVFCVLCAFRMYADTWKMLFTRLKANS